MGSRLPKVALNHQERAGQSIVRMAKKVYGIAHTPGDGYAPSTVLKLSGKGLQNHLEGSMGLHGSVNGVAVHQTLTDGQGPPNVRKLYVGQPLPGRPGLYGGYVRSHDGSSSSMSQPWRNAGRSIGKKAVRMGKTNLCEAHLATLNMQPTNAWEKVSQWIENLTHEVIENP